MDSVVLLAIVTTSLISIAVYEKNTCQLSIQRSLVEQNGKMFMILTVQIRKIIRKYSVNSVFEQAEKIYTSTSWLLLNMSFLSTSFEALVLVLFRERLPLVRL